MLVYQDGDDLWTIQFTPLHKGTYSICIEARAPYGLQAVSNKYRCEMLAPRLKTHRIDSLVFSSLLDHQFTWSLVPKFARFSREMLIHDKRHNMVCTNVK